MLRAGVATRPEDIMVRRRHLLTVLSWWVGVWRAGCVGVASWLISDEDMAITKQTAAAHAVWLRLRVLYRRARGVGAYDMIKQ